MLFERNVFLFPGTFQNVKEISLVFILRYSLLVNRGTVAIIFIFFVLVFEETKISYSLHLDAP